MKAIFISIVFFIGIAFANYDFQWNFYSFKTFISGGMFGVWITILANKLLMK